MSDGGMGDLSKIVSVIMQNPKLIEEISSLVNSSNVNADLQNTEIPEKNEEVQVLAEAKAPPASTPVSGQLHHRDKAARAQLLGALKPFVSSQRSGAIDSMLSISEILDMMRSR